MSPNRFRPQNLLCEAKDLLLPTTKLAVSNLSVSSPGSVFHPCSPDIIRVARILDAADFASRENCSFIRLNDAPRKTLLKPAKKSLRQPTLSTAAYSVNIRYKLDKQKVSEKKDMLLQIQSYIYIYIYICIQIYIYMHKG